MFQDRQFFQTMFKLALPIIIQYFIMFSLNMVDIIMIGQLGETAVAAVGLADQLFFLLLLYLFGVTSGAAIFTAQYWGKRQIARIKQVLGLCLMISLAGGILFTGLALFVPDVVLGLYSKDAEVVTLGSQYLVIVGWSYLIVAITFSYTTVLRSIEFVKLPMIISIIAIMLNTGLNYLLIFGHFGFPELGVTGAAIATTIARYIECIILLSIIYGQKLPLAATLPEMVNRDLAFVRNFLHTTIPVILTEIGWSLGITTYMLIYARISTESIAAVNIALTIDRVAFVIFLGVGTACGIMIGNQIGARSIDQAITYAKRYLILNPLMAVCVALIVISLADVVPTFYQISESVTFYTRTILILLGLFIPFRVLNFTILIGILRSGGDTRFSMFLDVGSIWLIGVPLAFTGAFILELPVYWVYAMAFTEELFKIVVGLWRIFSYRWINELALEPAT